MNGLVVQVAEDLSYVVALRRKFGYLESIPGVLLPHPSSAAFPGAGGLQDAAWAPSPTMDLYDPYYGAHAAAAQMHHIVPSMSSLEALLSKLPSVGPTAAPGAIRGAIGGGSVAKEELDDAMDAAGNGGGESTSAATTPLVPYYVDVAKPDEGF